jgi:hypothetical protein
MNRSILRRPTLTLLHDPRIAIILRLLNGKSLKDLRPLVTSRQAPQRIPCLSQHLSPRIVRVCRIPTPSEPKEFRSLAARRPRILTLTTSRMPDPLDGAAADELKVEEDLSEFSLEAHHGFL